MNYSFDSSSQSFIVRPANGIPGQQLINMSDIKISGATGEEIVRGISVADYSPRRDETISNIKAQIVESVNTRLSKSPGPVYDSYGNYIGENLALGQSAAFDNGLMYKSVNVPMTQATINYSNSGEARKDNPTSVPSPSLSPSLPKTGDKVFEYKTTSGVKMQDTLSGADLCIYYLVEVPDERDIEKGVPREIAKKRLITVEFDSVLSVSYSTIREKFPVRSLGSSNPKGMTSGIRTISGHIAFNIFAEDVLSRLRGRIAMDIERREDEIVNNINLDSPEDDITPANQQLKYLGQEQQAYIKSPLLSKGYRSMLLDQLPPFHLLIMGVNDHGVMSRMMIKNVSIIDENQYQGTQQPNIINKVTFVATDIVPMTARQYDTTLISGSLSSMEEGYVGGNWDYSGVDDMSASSLLLDIESGSILRKAQGEF